MLRVAPCVTSCVSSTISRCPRHVASRASRLRHLRCSAASRGCPTLPVLPATSTSSSGSFVTVTSARWLPLLLLSERAAWRCSGVVLHCVQRADAAVMPAHACDTSWCRAPAFDFSFVFCVSKMHSQVLDCSVTSI